MARYIDADKEIIGLKYALARVEPTETTKIVVGEFIKMLEQAPTADVEEVKHGEWIRPTKLADMMHNVPHCSICGEVPCDEGQYCPNCGAKMDGGKAE